MPVKSRLPLAGDAVLGTLAAHQTGMGNALSRTLQSAGVVLGTALRSSTRIRVPAGPRR
jgi:hypothetical protein